MAFCQASLMAVVHSSGSEFSTVTTTSRLDAEGDGDANSLDVLMSPPISSACFSRFQRRPVVVADRHLPAMGSRPQIGPSISTSGRITWYPG